MFSTSSLVTIPSKINVQLGGQCSTLPLPQHSQCWNTLTISMYNIINLDQQISSFPDSPLSHTHLHFYLQRIQRTSNHNLSLPDTFDYDQYLRSSWNSFLQLYRNSMLSKLSRNFSQEHHSKRFSRKSSSLVSGCSCQAYS